LSTDLARFAERNRLTAREQEVLALLVRGHDSVPRIADTLSLSRNTVHNHFKNIFRRTRCNSKTALLAKFISGVAARRARPAVAAPRVLLLQPQESYLNPVTESLARLGMQVYVEGTPARLLDRVRDLRIHAVVTDGELAGDGPLAVLAEMYGEHPVIFHVRASESPQPAGASGAGLVARSFELPAELDAMAIAIYRHCNESSYGIARARRVSTTLSVRVGGKAQATMTNLSTGGAFLELPGDNGKASPPLPGDQLELDLELSDGDCMPVRAEVVWTRQGAAPGVGVKFLGIPPEYNERLHQLIAVAAP
jgi:DNA-binding NarL/FixJ family response regulator